MSELDKDFEKTLAKVNQKLQEATKALKKANKLAKEIGFNHGLIFGMWAKEEELGELESSLEEKGDSKTDPYELLREKYSQINVSDLEQAMAEAGWSTSSSYC